MDSKRINKYYGVWFDKNRNKYRAVCQGTFIGRFDTAKEAALAYDKRVRILADERIPLNFGEWNRTTQFQLECYILCSPDFFGLTQRAAAQILGTYHPCVSIALKRLKKKVPILFPIYQKWKCQQRFEDWMSNEVRLRI